MEIRSRTVVVHNKIEEPVFIRSGGELILFGLVVGDITLESGRLDLKGMVAGDVLAIESSIRLDGIVEGSLQLERSTLTVQGIVRGSIVSRDSQVDVDDKAIVVGEVIAAPLDSERTESQPED